jgi:drug/metabolite transporter (DMT)-like permease
MWVALSAVAYSLFAVFTKHALAQGLRPSDLLVWRFGIAVPAVWLLVLVQMWRGGPRPTQAPIVRMLVLGVLFGVLAMLGFSALDHLSAGLYTVIIYTYPAMVAAGAWALGHTSPRALWGAVGVTLVGIGLTTVPAALSSSSTVEGVGIVLALLNALAYAIYVLWSGRLMTSASAHRYDGIVAAAWSLTGSMGFAALVGLVAGGVRAPHTASSAWGLVGLSLVSTVVASVALLIGISSLGPATAATIATLEPVLTLLWAVVVLGESLRVVQLLGAALVIGGITWAQRMVGAVEPGIDIAGPPLSSPSNLTG